MSHKVTTKTTIKNKKLALQALKAAGWRYSERGSNIIDIQGGPMHGSWVDLSTGTVTGDTDYHGKTGLKALNKHYSEALVRAEAQKNGGQIIERTVAKNKDIVLIAQYG